MRSKADETFVIVETSYLIIVIVNDVPSGKTN